MTTPSSRLEPPPALAKAMLRLSLVASGILAGMVLSVWLVEVSFGPAAEPWINYHQAIRGPYTSVVPPLGALAGIGAVVATICARHPTVHRPLVMAAVGCLVSGMVVTVGLHFPMNAVIDTWSSTAPPGEWEQMRRDWLVAHTVRSVLAVAAFVLLATAATKGERRNVSRSPAAAARKVRRHPSGSSTTETVVASG